MVKATILIIEDEEFALNQYKEMLALAGYEVLTALSGREGLKILEKDKDNVDLVVLDLMMPGMSGVEVLEEIRGDTKKYGTPKVIVLTNLTNELMIKECFNLGTDGYLLKTEIDVDSFVKDVEKVLQGEKI